MKRDQPKRRRDRKTGISPYQRHGKTPYQYSFHNCKHGTRERQLLRDFAGLVCKSCGTIIENYTEGKPRLHFGRAA